jgi:hypothetical protein
MLLSEDAWQRVTPLFMNRDAEAKQTEENEANETNTNLSGAGSIHLHVYDDCLGTGHKERSSREHACANRRFNRGPPN